MNPPPLPPPVPPAGPEYLPGPAEVKPALSPEQTLRRLFLTLFLRGYSARGLQKSKAPTSVGSKLALTLVMYGLTGFMALIFLRQSVFSLALYMHGATFMFLGMFVAASAGEILFNQQEADILLHRPVEPRALLWAKIGVLVQVSLWLGGAFNLIGLGVGVFIPDGGWRYPLIHALSTALEALFCMATVVLVYQLCLRWFGRERLNGLMTTAQVVVAVTAVAAGQIIPRIIGRFGAPKNLTSDTWWLVFLPPAWFAGLDDALAGRGNLSSWLLAALGLLVTAVVLWVAFGKLADDYVSGLQAMGETAGPKPKPRVRRRWLDRLVEAPPLCWWLRNSVARASFLLTLAYLARDRDVKLRVYPGVAPILILPFIFFFQSHGRHDDGAGGFGVAFTGAFLDVVPMSVISLLQISQNWQAADLFRVAPMLGPTLLFDGMRRAVMLFIALPLAVFFGVAAWLVGGGGMANLALLLPGLILLPVYALVPGLGGRSMPLSQPVESAKAARRGLRMLLAGIIPFAVAGLAMLAWSFGCFRWFLLAETVLAAGVYAVMRWRLNSAAWPSLE
jgi:hypothetical protein